MGKFQISDFKHPPKKGCYDNCLPAWCWKFLWLLEHGVGSFYIAWILMTQAGSLSAREEIPALLPPLGELEPAYWEQHGWPVILAAIGGLIFLALAICFLRRSKPPALEAPDVLARKLLKRLSGRAENGALISEVSRIMRIYMLSALSLPIEEHTTSEFCARLVSQRQIKPELSEAIGDFLRHCDEVKFSPLPPVAQFDAISRALKLIDQVESGRREMARPDAGIKVMAVSQ